MKTRTTFILYLTAIVALAAGSAFGAYSGGTGEPNNPYQIATKADLLALAANTGDYSKCFILTADINMRGQVFTTAIITSGPPFAEITGTFDGNNHKITNLTINGGAYVGLFGYINSNSCSVKNLGFENCSVSGKYYVGGLVGENDGSLTDCYAT
jgi:The GLUG motif